MHTQLICTGFTTLLSIALASALESSEWKVVAPVNKSEVVRGRVTFHQPRMDEAEALLLDISDPDSPRFGQHLDQKGLEEFFEPSKDSQERVLVWLESVGIDRKYTRLRKASANIDFFASIRQMEKLLSTQYFIEERNFTGDRRSGSSKQVIPRHLQEHVEFVIAVSRALQPSKKKASLANLHPPSPIEVDFTVTPQNLKKCEGYWTPACLRHLYKIPLGTRATKNNSMGICGNLDAYDQANLDNFWSKFANFIPKGTGPKVHGINGAQAPGSTFDGEELLDISLAFPIIWPQKLELYQTPAIEKYGLLNDLLDAVDGSYCHYQGGDDPQFDNTYPEEGGYNHPPIEWMKLALRGVTAIAASGDGGVGGHNGCSREQQGTPILKFEPDFPAACPYITTVGATQVRIVGKEARNAVAFQPQVQFYSGGGFSEFNSRPAYQREAVDKYLQGHDPKYPNGTFNRAGRGFPDVTMIGVNLTFSVLDMITNNGAGTSASTPIFAAIINRINDDRLLAGKKPIGFLNTILFKHPEIFTDLTEGYNPGCNTVGFEAAKGWDPVSGLGTTDYPRLHSLLFNLP